MRKMIGVHTGEVMAGRGEVVLRSDANKACFVIAAHDSHEKIGCLAHALFLSSGLDEKQGFPMIRDASRTVDTMIEDMVRLGAARDHIEVCLVSGENVPHQKGDQDYADHISSFMEILKGKHIRLKEDTPTDIGDLHVSIDAESGSISYVRF